MAQSSGGYFSNDKLRPITTCDSHGSIDAATPREDPLYQNATTGPDGLYHCPWESKDPACTHKPVRQKYDY
jgi:hypothetical protein